MAPLALVANLATRWRHLHWFQSWPPGSVTCIATLPWIALLALSASIELVSSSARVTSVKSQQGVGLTHWHPDPKIGPQVYLGPLKNLFGREKYDSGEVQLGESNGLYFTNNAGCNPHGCFGGSLQEDLNLGSLHWCLLHRGLSG